MRRLLKIKRIGHAGTLDPLAQGILPLAIGRATKLLPFIQNTQKTYRFRIRFGTQTSTDDAEGLPLHTSSKRPSTEDIKAALSHFEGDIAQVPPTFCALKVNGKRAYALARKGDAPELKARPAYVHRLRLLEHPCADEALFELVCASGFYVRALARDLSQALGTRGHVSFLERTQCGPFLKKMSIFLDDLERLDYVDLSCCILSFKIGLEGACFYTVTHEEALALSQGRSIDLKTKQDVAPNGPSLNFVEGSHGFLAHITFKNGRCYPSKIISGLVRI